MNNFLRVKSKNRAAHLRLAARLFSIMMLAFLWPARGEAQADEPLSMISLILDDVDYVDLRCASDGNWFYKIPDKMEVPFNGTLTGTEPAGKVFRIKSEKEVTDGDPSTYPKLILDRLNYTSSGAVFEMASGSNPVYIQTAGASKLVSKGLGTGSEYYVIHNTTASLVIDGGINGLEISKEADYNSTLYGIHTNKSLDVFLQGKITVAVHNTGVSSNSSSKAIEVGNSTRLSYGESANIRCMAQSGFSIYGTISSPFLEWTFADAPAAGELEIRDANGQSLNPAVKFTTDGKAKTFTISAKKDTPYTLWLNGKKQKNSNGATSFMATKNDLINFTGITEFLPSNWSEYGQEAQVGPTGADVTVSDNTHYTVHTSAGFAWIAWVTNNGKNNTDEDGKSYPTNKGFEGCTVTLDSDISLAKPENGVADNFYANWYAIGSGYNSDKRFKGTLDGGNHTISGLSMTQGFGDYNGLFSYIEGAVIKNLRVEGKIEGESTSNDNTCMGGIAGFASNSKIIACSNAVKITVTAPATVDKELNIGGIVGQVSSSDIRSCWNEASLSGEPTQMKFNIGGIAGRSNSPIDNCYSSGPVSGTGTSTSACASGGIVGYIENVVVSNCYATGSVSATNAQDGSTTSAGGIAGHIKNVEVSYCLALNAGDGIKIFANGSTSHVGRIVGQQEGICRLDNNYASTQIKLQKGSDPEAAPTTEIAANKINGADVYLDDVANAIAAWTGDGKAFTAIGTDEATGMLPQLKTVIYGTDGLPSTYGDAIAGQPAANMKSADYLAKITALELSASSLTITLSYSDNKWSYKKGDGALTRFDGTVKMAQGVNSSPTSLVVETATGNPTLTFENVKLNMGDNKSSLSIKEGCTLTLHTTGDKPLTLTSSGNVSVLVNKGILTLTGTGLFISHFNADTSYCLKNDGTFTVSNPEETSVILNDMSFSLISGNGTLGNAWIEWRFNSKPGKIAFTAIDDTNQSPDAQTVQQSKIATLVIPGKTYRLWKVTGEGSNEVRTRQAGTKDSKTVALFPAPTKGEVAVYTDVKNVNTAHIYGKDNFSNVVHSGNDVIVYSGGKLTITDTDTDAQVLNLTLKEGGQVVTTKPLKVIETFSTTRELANQWIAFGSPVAMKASVKDNSQVFYVATGYNGTVSTDQGWKNIFETTPDTGTKTADLVADSPYLLAAEPGSTQVTFAATAVTDPLVIPQTAEVTPGNALADGVFLFRTNPNLSDLTLSNIYVLNAEGTRFELQENYELKPFEAYITANEETCSRVRSLKIGDNIATGIDQPIAATTRIWGTRGMLHINAAVPADVMIVTPAGQILRTVKAPAGDTTLALPAGIYFVRCNDITYKVSL